MGNYEQVDDIVIFGVEIDWFTLFHFS
jgi:hypothetical protein